MPTVATESSTDPLPPPSRSGVSRPGTSGGGERSAELQGTVSTHLQALCLEMARETLHSAALEEFHESDYALYSFLADYFERLREQQQHESNVGISRDALRYVLSNVYANAHLAALGSGNAAEKRALSRLQSPADVPSPIADPSGFAALMEEVISTRSGPLVAQRSLREQLQGGGVNVAALAEVLELSRFLDSQRGHTVPFGQVNVTHVAAVLITLYPCDSLFALISEVFDALPPTTASSGGASSTGRPGTARGTPTYRAADLQKARLFSCWATIDATNRDALNNLAELVISRPNLTLPLALEAQPALRAIHTGEHATAVASEAQKHRVVEYGGQDDAEKRPGHRSSSGPVVASYGADDDEAIAPAEGQQHVVDDVEEDSPPEESQTEREAAAGFWSALVS